MKISLKMTGCKNNRYELDQIILWAAQNGVELVSDESEADFCVINTCTVTHVADRKSRQLIRKTKNHNPKLKTIVFGCGARVQKKEFETIGEIDYLFQDLKSVLGFLCEHLSYHSDRVKRVEESLNYNEISHSRALVQIQDGCDNFCTYCITVLARGRSKNRPEDEIIGEINDRVKEGYNEIVLTGINIGAYGCSATTKPEESRLAELLQDILNKTTIKRIRLTSMGPEYFYNKHDLAVIPREAEGDEESHHPSVIPREAEGDEESHLNEQLFTVLQNSRVCRHIHLAVQSGSDEVLKKMRRNYTVKQMDAVIKRLKKDIPGIAITADIIVGFPEETDVDFKNTVDFVKRNKLAKTHVFPYSVREGTPAAKMEQVADAVKKERARKLQKIADEHREEFIKNQIGKKISVLWEKEVKSGLWEGLTDNYIRIRKKGDYFWRSVTDEIIEKKDIILPF